VAEDYMHGLQRLRSFVQKNAPGRPIVVGEVGHQWDMDAMVTYLGNRRAVNYEGYKKISQAEGIMQEAEMTEILIDPSGSDVSYVEYRGNRFQIFGIT